MSNPSQIVVIHDSLEVRGGATVLARLSAQLYRDQGFEVTYIAGGQGTADDTELEGINVLEIGSQSLLRGARLKSMVRGINNPETVDFIANWIRENDTPDTAYHLHNWAQTLSPSIFKALRPVEDRTIMSCHDVFNICPNGGLINFGSGLPCQLKPMSVSCWASQCDRRSSVHKYWRMTRQVHLNRTAQFDRSQITYVCLHKGMEDLMRQSGFTPPFLTSVTNPATGYTSDRIEAERNDTFLYIGRLNREKGADLAVEAAIETGMKLILIGDGELADSFRDKRENIKLAGFCNRSEIAKYARSARGLIVPSRWPEPYGLVIAEAALSGLPIIVSQPTLLSAQVQQLGMGDQFEIEGDDNLASVLRRWHNDSDLVRTKSTNAYDRALEICSTPEGWAQQFVDIMREKIKHSSARR